MKSNRNKYLALSAVITGLTVMSCILFQACESSDNLKTEKSLGNSNEVEEKTNLLPILDRIELDNGASVTIEKGPNDNLVVVTEYPAAVKEDMETMLTGKDSVEEIYKALAPERKIPAEINQIVKNIRIADVTTLDNSYKGGLISMDDQIDSMVDDMSIQNKTVSRDVTYFIDTHCYTDKIHEGGVRGDWFRNMPKCLTERTNGFQQTYYGVRQSHMVYRPYRGNSYLNWYWLDGETWTLGNSYFVEEGFYKQVRVGGTGIYDIRWNNSSADGDGYHYTIHNAVGDINLMKLDEGDDKYHIYCLCPERTSPPNLATPKVDGILEVCMPNTMTWNDKQAMEYCQDFGIAQGVSTCTATSNGPLNRERVTATTYCSGSLKVCWYKVEGIGESNWNSSCVDCNETCP